MMDLPDPKLPTQNSRMKGGHFGPESREMGVLTQQNAWLDEKFGKKPFLERCFINCKEVETINANGNGKNEVSFRFQAMRIGKGSN